MIASNIRIIQFKTICYYYYILLLQECFFYVSDLFQQSLPMRHKAIHCLNVPSALKYVYDFARSRFSQKIRDRFMVRNLMLHFILIQIYSLSQSSRGIILFKKIPDMNIVCCMSMV